MVHFRCTRSWVARSPGNLVLVVVVVVLVVVARGRPCTATCYGARAYHYSCVFRVHFQFGAYILASHGTFYAAILATALLFQDHDINIFLIKRHAYASIN